MQYPFAVIALLGSLLVAVQGQGYDPYRDYYRPSNGRLHARSPQDDYYNNGGRYPEYDNRPRDTYYASEPEIVIRPNDVVQFTWGHDDHIYALCSVAAVEQYAISWIRRMPDHSVVELSSNHELNLRNIKADDLNYPIFCQLRRSNDGATFERQLTIAHRSSQPSHASQSLNLVTNLQLEIVPLPGEDLPSGQIARLCRFAGLETPRAEFVWIDEDERVVVSGNEFRRRLNSPLELSKFSCRATDLDSGSIFTARTRVSQQETRGQPVEWSQRGPRDQREPQRDFVVNIRSAADHVLFLNEHTMICEVTPATSEPVDFTWYYNNQLVGTGAQLRIPRLTEEAIGSYTCAAEWRSPNGARMDNFRSNATMKINLEVTQAMEIDLMPPPGSSMVSIEGVRKELHCEFNSANPRQVDWYFNEQRLDSGHPVNRSGQLQRSDHLLVSIISIKQTEKAHSGRYKCVADGVEKMVYLYIKIDAELMVNPRSQTVDEGDAAELHCRIEKTQYSNRDLQWFFQAANSDRIEELRFYPDGNFQRTDAPNAALTSFVSTLNARKSDAGAYICRHPATNSEAVGHLIVNQDYRPVPSYRIHITPSVIHVRAGQAITAECYIQDSSGAPAQAAPAFRLRDQRVRFDSTPTASNRARFDIRNGLTREFNGTEVECYSTIDGMSTAAIIVIEDVCPSDHRRCRSGECMMAGRFCDGRRDCIDGSDEDPSFCDVCDPIAKRCGNHQGVAPSKDIYMIHWTCDGESDCGNDYDEMNCDGYRDSRCAAGRFQCPYDSMTLPWSFVCDGENDCSRGEDERNCAAPVIQTPSMLEYRSRVGTTVTLTCRVTGYPLPFVIWRFNWHCLPDEGGRFRWHNTAEQCGSPTPTVVSTLTISNVQPGDDGIYNCEGLSGVNRALSADYRLMLEY